MSLHEVEKDQSFRNLKGFEKTPGHIVGLPLFSEVSFGRISHTAQAYHYFYSQNPSGAARILIPKDPNKTVSMDHIDEWRRDMETIRKYRDTWPNTYPCQDPIVVDTCNAMRERLGLLITRALFVWRCENGE